MGKLPLRFAGGVGLLSLAAAASVAGLSGGSRAPAAAPLAAGQRFLERPQHRSPLWLLTMDHHLLDADFIGEVVVRSVRPATVASAADSVTTASGSPIGASSNVSSDVMLVTLDIADSWYSRWPPVESMQLGIGASANYGGFMTEGARLVVLLSGGSWLESPFTFREHSIFRVADDEHVECVGGTVLFGIHNGGFVCSIQAYMPSPPILVSEMREATLQMRERASRRLPDHERLLSVLSRPLRLYPSSTSAVGPLEDEEFR